MGFLARLIVHADKLAEMAVIMRAFIQALLQLPLQAPPAAVATSPAAESSRLIACFEPLVGGPSFLPLHVVIEHEASGSCFDFLPEDPLALETTLALVTGAAVPGKVRHRTARRSRRGVVLGATTKSVDAILNMARQQPSELRLLRNDCWSFAARVRDFCI